MLTLERFKRWRGEKAKDEEVYYNLAAKMSDFVDTLAHIDTIKAGFVASPPIYTEWEKSGKSKMGWAVVVLCALLFDEYLEQLPTTASNEERLAITGLNTALHAVYAQEGSVNELCTKLWEKSAAFLAINVEEFSQIHKAKKIYISLFLLLIMAKTKLEPVSSWKLWIIGISKEPFLENVNALLPQVEKRVNEINAVPKLASKDKTIQEHIYECYVILLNRTSSTPSRIHHFSTGMDKTSDKIPYFIAGIGKMSEGIERLGVVQKEKKEVLAKIEKVQGLLNALGNNKTKGEFLTLLDSHKEAYDLITQAVQTPLKNQLVADIDKLKTEKAPSKAEQAAANLLMKSPKKMQQLLTYLPSEALLVRNQENLKRLAEDYSNQIRIQMEEVEKRIRTAVFELAGNDTSFRTRLEEQDPEQLKALLSANNALKEVVEKYNTLSTNLNKKMVILRKMQHSGQELAEFIRINDGFFVWLSNFFAQFLSFFKSDTALLVDKAKEMKLLLDERESRYQKEVNQELEHIKAIEIAKPVKNELLKEFNGTPILPRARVLKADDIHSMAENLSHLFATADKTVEKAIKETRVENNMERGFAP